MTNQEAINKSDLIAYRDYQPDDFNFIISTWLQGLYHGNEFFNLIEKQIYFDSYHFILETLIPKSTIKVACLKESPDVILGYSVYDKNTLHWIFVKEVWRKIGIATKLVPQNIDQYSHFSTVGYAILNNKHLPWTFNPFTI